MLKKFDDIDLLAAPHISNKIVKDGYKDILISYSYAEILAKDTNKWTAVKTLADKLGIKTKPVITGPFTFLKLAKFKGRKNAGDYVNQIIEAYSEVLEKFNKLSN